MLDNHMYNLMNQLIEEHKSLWRIKNEYLEDAGDCADCQEFWQKLVDEKQSHIDQLMELITTHIGSAE